MPLIKKGVGKPATSHIAQREEDKTKDVRQPPDAEASESSPQPDSHVPDSGKSDTGTKDIQQLQTLQEGAMLQGRYRVEGILGIGGMSVVYRGRDMRFKDVIRECAIKEMYQRAPDSQTRLLNLRHFEREASLLATLNHPAIPKVYDFFEEETRFYLVQEMVPGKDLETLLEEREKPFSEDRVGNWAIQICDVLTYLHNHRPDPIVFRDMKPSNILLTPEERIVLIDFGIARLIDPNERKGTMIGTEGYAPPEQYRGMAEPQGDLYALAATMHHLLTSTDPRLETPFTFHERPITTYNPSVSEEMQAAINKSLEYDMQSRWPSALEFKQALMGVPGMSGSLPAQPMPSVQAPAVGTTTIGSTRLEWEFTCEDELRSSPCVTDELVLIGCYDHNLYAIDRASGKFRWKYATEGGISSSPTVWQDIAIIGSEDGCVYGVDLRTGKRRWIFRTEKPVRSSPRVHERIAFVGSDDMHFYALDGLRGVMIWKYRVWNPFRSSACIGKGVVFVGCDDAHIYCLEIRSSTLKWKQRTQSSIYSTPACQDGLVIVGSTDSYLYALDSKTGMIAWKFRAGHQILASPTIVDGQVFIGSADGNMYAVEVKNGRQLWKYEVEGQINSSVCSAEGRLYFGSTNGKIYCLDISGKLVWSYETEAPVVSSPSVRDGIVYVGSMDNRIYALKA